MSLYQMLPAATMAGKLEAGEKVSPQELALLHEAMTELSRPSTPGARALDWTASGGSLALELASTAGTYTALKKGALTHAAKGFQNLLTKAGRKTVEKLMEKPSTAKEGVQKLYSYSHRKFEGDVLETGPGQGRLWATKHYSPRDGWAFAPGLKNTIVRRWRTGSWDPFEDMTEITGPALAQFRKVRAIGPFRGWKRVGGQYYTTKPGNLNLRTGVFDKPKLKDRILRVVDPAVSHGLDTLTYVAPPWYWNYLYERERQP